MDEQIVFEDRIFQSENGAYEIYKAMCGGEECYCITHIDNGERYSLIFDCDKRILQAIVQKIKRTNIVMGKTSSGSRFNFRFCQTEKENSITVRLFLWAKYNNLPLSKVRDCKIELLDKSLYGAKILDMRKENMYNAGDADTCGISVVTDPFFNRDFIIVENGNRVEYMDYSPELYQLLITRKYCTGCCTGKNGRLIIGIKHTKGQHGSCVKHLAKFVTMFYDYFGKYRNHIKGSYARFIHSVPRINEDLAGLDCGHLNDCSWNSCRENVLFMDKTINIKSKRNSKLIAGRYRMLPIVLRSGSSRKILIEWEVDGSLVYFICNNEYEYFDFQQTVLGKNKVIANLNLYHDNGNGERSQILTPKQSIPEVMPKSVSPSKQEIMREILLWNTGRERILDLFQRSPETFRKWRSTENGITTEVLEQILVLVGMQK